MKNRTIYAILIVIILMLCYIIYKQYYDIKDLEMVLEQCEDAYYKSIGLPE